MLYYSIASFLYRWRTLVSTGVCIASIERPLFMFLTDTNQDRKHTLVDVDSTLTIIKHIDDSKKNFSIFKKRSHS